MPKTKSRSSGNRRLALAAILPLLGLGACLLEQGTQDDFGTVWQGLTQTIQGESQSWTTSSGDSISASSSNARLQANAVGDSFSFTASVSSGTYSVAIKYAKRNVYGNYRVEVNGAAIGTLSGYTNNTSDVWNTATFNGVNLSGTVKFGFVVTGKDSASTDYDIKIDSVTLTSSSSTGSGGSTSSGGSTGSGGSSSTGGTKSTGGTTSSGGTSGSSGGMPSCTIPSATGSQSVSSTISVSGTFDGGLKRYVGSGTLGTSSQSESQGPLFNLADGATLKNVIIGNPAADGVHCNGNCTLQNVYWEDVGEDAATQKGKKTGQVMTINGGVARNASDKIFQHNGTGTMVIQNFCADTFGKIYRSCGNCSTQFQRNVTLSNVVGKNGSVIAGINTNYGDVARYSKIFITGSPKICDKFIGNNTGAEPKEIGSGPDSTNCLYTSSDITKF